jgi:selenide,water dikinase
MRAQAPVFLRPRNGSGPPIRDNATMTSPATPLGIASPGAPIRLTQYSHGAGCGCKISPKVLDVILAGSGAQNLDPRLWVGNASRDDAAVYALDDERGVVSTTDFFMPIVDDPFDFGRIAATNAISDIYAMGADPLMAIAILGWPVNLLPPEVARDVVRGGRAACDAAGIPLAGGHSIDAPEPIFGLAVTGAVQRRHMKRNDTATEGCRLYLTKPLGIGIFTTAEKKSKLQPQDVGRARDLMCALNQPGSHFGKLKGVRAMTDVTGFGLLGHLVEMADGSGLTAIIDYAAVPRLSGVEHYLAEGCVPGGTERNFDSYGARIAPLGESQKQLLCDPQTSGGLLVAVSPEGEQEFLSVAQGCGLQLNPIGRLTARQSFAVVVN